MKILIISLLSLLLTTNAFADFDLAKTYLGNDADNNVMSLLYKGALNCKPKKSNNGVDLEICSSNGVACFFYTKGKLKESFCWTGYGF